MNTKKVLDRNAHVITLGVSMKSVTTTITKIGNSQGVRIPKSLLKHLKGVSTVKLTQHKHGILIEPETSVLDEWESSLREFYKNGGSPEDLYDKEWVEASLVDPEDDEWVWDKK